VMRFKTYGVALDGEAAKYAKAMRESAAITAWVSAALKETEFVPEDEPYATAPG
jgi:hypothetical protein